MSLGTDPHLKDERFDIPRMTRKERAAVAAMVVIWLGIMWAVYLEVSR